MPLDAVFLTALTKELRQSIVASRIDKVQQPDHDSILLTLRCKTGNNKLLISCNPNRPRAHLTHVSYENPSSAPMFCMLLRKHFSGGHISCVDQPPMERVLDITIDCMDEMGTPDQKHLILEMMGRNSNLIVTGSDGRIIDCIRRVDYEMSEKRQVLPGLFYHLPPGQNKKNPLNLSMSDWQKLLLSVSTERRLDQWLMDTFAGLSPLICRELAFLASGETDADLNSFSYEARQNLAKFLFQQMCIIQKEDFVPVLLLREDMPSDFSYRTITQYGNLVCQRTTVGFSQLLDEFYSARDQAERLKSRSSAMTKTISNLLNRCIRKLNAQRQELMQSENRERLRQLGDIVTANLSSIRRGQARLVAEDFYDPEMKQIEIFLQPHLSPQQNAAKYYKDYTKAKHAQQYLTEQISIGEEEQSYLESVLDEISRACNERELSEIRQELIDGTYLKAGSKKNNKVQMSKPRHFVSAEGFDIYVGRNNRQNDQLTLKTARKTDIWLHAQKIHGSHVIILCEKSYPGKETLAQAAMLAALYSQASQSQNVPVDYTSVKNVRKPSGAKPGMVTYDHYNTTWATPDPGLASKLECKK